MKIELDNILNEINAELIDFGECFLYNDELYIRTTGEYCGKSVQSHPIRIVRLSDGSENGIYIDTKVITIKVKCVKDGVR